MPAKDADLIDLKIAVNAGDPVEKSNKLFGDAIQHAANICSIAGNFRVAIAAPVRDLVSKDYSQNKKQNVLALAPQDETLLRLLFNKLEEHWQNPDFDIDDYCREMAMSTSQLYRKTIALTGLSLNLLLKGIQACQSQRHDETKTLFYFADNFRFRLFQPVLFYKVFQKEVWTAADDLHRL